MTTAATKGRPRTVRVPQEQPEATSEGELQHYSSAETAAFLNVSPRFLADLIANGEITCSVIAGHYKFTPAHIREYSAKQELKAGPRGSKAA